MINLIQFLSFIKVIEHKSFTLAAKELYLTQPAVTNQIRLLEEDYGVELLDRSGREIIPTASGEGLFNFARRILDIYDQSKNELDRLNNLLRGSLIVGASTGPGEHILPKLLGDFKSHHPNIDIVLRVSRTEEIIRQTLERELEVGIVGATSKENALVFEPFIKDDIILICGPKHHLAGKTPIRFESILNEPFIIQQKGAGIRTMFETGLAKRGLSIKDMNIFMELGLQESIKSAVAENFGLGIITRYAVRHEFVLGSLVEVEVQDLPVIRNEFYLVRNLKRKLSPLTEAFLSFAKQHIKS